VLFLSGKVQCGCFVRMHSSKWRSSTHEATQSFHMAVFVLLLASRSFFVPILPQIEL